MAIEFVDATDVVEDLDGTSVAATTPAGLQSGDLLIATVYTTGTLTIPSGWSSVTASAGVEIDEGLSYFTLTVLKKTSVASGDSEQSITWQQADTTATNAIGVAYAAWRGVDAIVESGVTDTGGMDDVITPVALTSSSAGEVIVVSGAVYIVGSATLGVTVPSGFSTVSTGHVVTAWKEFSSGQSNSGNIDWGYGTSNASARAAATLRLTSTVPPTNDVRISSDSMLGDVMSAVTVRPSLLASAPSMLGTSAARVLSDFTQLAKGLITRYVMDVITPTATVRMPISTWQATLQTDAACYVQCVVPAIENYVDDLEDGTEFVITRLVTRPDGQTLTYEMARAPLEVLQFAQGAFNYTATLSGYTDALAADANPPTGYDRTLEGVRTVFTSAAGLRVRCNIDWLLRPGMRAYWGDTPLLVAYINYYCSTSEEYMDVGERNG